MTQVVLHVTYRCAPDKAVEFIMDLKQSGLQSLVRQEDGCLQYDYFLPVEQADQLLLVEKWTNRDAQAVHMTQPHMAKMKEFKGDYIAPTTLGEVTL